MLGSIPRPERHHGGLHLAPERVTGGPSSLRPPQPRLNEDVSTLEQTLNVMLILPRLAVASATMKRVGKRACKSMHKFEREGWGQRRLPHLCRDDRCPVAIWLSSQVTRPALSTGGRANFSQQIQWTEIDPFAGLPPHSTMVAPVPLMGVPAASAE